MLSFYLVCRFHDITFSILIQVWACSSCFFIALTWFPSQQRHLSLSLPSIIYFFFSLLLIFFFFISFSSIYIIGSHPPNFQASRQLCHDCVKVGVHLLLHQSFEELDCVQWRSHLWAIGNLNSHWDFIEREFTPTLHLLTFCDGQNQGLV